VVQTISTFQGTPDLRLNNLAQDPGSAGTKGPAPTAGPRGGTPVVAPGGNIDVLLSGLPVASDPQKLGVDVIEEGEVEGSICDCGDILLPAGAFPKWPLLFLTAVPLVFIHDCNDCDNDTTPTPTPTPPTTPTPTPTPEPASLLLFGTGLLAVGAGLRRRHAKTKLEHQLSANRDDE